MLCALMWIARCAWMRALMNLQSFVELERLLQIGLQGWFLLSFVKTRIVDKIWFENWIYLEQWVVLFPLRRPWLLDYLCSNLPYHKFKNFLRRGPQSMLNTWFLVTSFWLFGCFKSLHNSIRTAVCLSFHWMEKLVVPCVVFLFLLSWNAKVL